MLLPKRHESERDVPALYRLAARTGGVFVNSAFIELFGLTAIEASACGLPFVATREGGPAEIVERCNGGVTVDVTDHDELVDEIRKLLTDRGHWNRLSRNGELCTREHYSWASHAERYLSAVGNLSRHSAEPTALPPTTPIGEPETPPAVLVLSDIDGTLTGDDEAIGRLHAYLTGHPEVMFGVATGRTHESAVDAPQGDGVRPLRRGRQQRRLRSPLRVRRGAGPRVFPLAPPKAGTARRSRRPSKTSPAFTPRRALRTTSRTRSASTSTTPRCCRFWWPTWTPN